MFALFLGGQNPVRWTFSVGVALFDKRGLWMFLLRERGRLKRASAGTRKCLCKFWRVRIFDGDRSLILAHRERGDQRRTQNSAIKEIAMQ